MSYLHSGNRGLLFVAACVALLSAGCTTDLDGRSKQLSKYDKEKDQFHFLWVCTDIVASRTPLESGPRKLTAEQHREVGLNHIESLWKDRENVVLLPGPFGPIAFIRKENRLLETVSLFNSGEKREKFTTNFDLDAIRVLPGEMFVSPKGTLSYSHHCIVPGATIDHAFKLMMQGINPELQKGTTARIAARKKDEQKRVAWSDLRKELWNGVNVGQRFSLVSRVLEKFPEALSDESLELLSKQGEKQAIALERKEMNFTLRMQLTPSDAKEFCAAMEEALRGELPDPSKSTAPGGAEPYSSTKKLEAKANEAFREAKATADAEGRVSMSLELMPVLKLLEDDGGPWGFVRDQNLNEKQLKDAKADVSEVENRKIPVSRKVKLEMLIEGFQGEGK